MKMTKEMRAESKWLRENMDYNMREAKLVARICFALAQSSTMVGQTCRSEEAETVAQRAHNLCRPHGTYGPYVRPGDPQGWGGGGALACLYIECIGLEDDCYVPSHYSEFGEDSAMDVTFKAGGLLGDVYFECCNAAVYCCYEA